MFPSDRYTVLSVTQTQDVAGNDELTDVLEIGFAVTGRPGVFTYQVNLTAFPGIQFGIDLTAAADVIDALYSL